MTVEERLAELERRTNLLVPVYYTDPATGRLVEGLKINGRTGICTDYWIKQPLGEGACLSVGASGNRFGAYVEIDEESCPDHPAVAVYAACVPAPGAGRQSHVAFHGVVGNAGDGNDYVLLGEVRDHAVGLRYEGLELIGSWLAWAVGKATSFRLLWP